ncbi:hypothetical protein ILUMI_11506 [Ignelater luminosus]|uniref:Transposase n=1 Tax=Ignelater luminosus TaxID=2038154 RepID=A0A8K0D206_IGNLU|nr:hypothetical protein ILUMI_11506 [Ignelater luminosus]
MPTFSAALENHLHLHIKDLKTLHFGLTTNDLRELAYEFAEKNNILHRFSHISRKAGWDSLKGFRTRNPSISLRVPEATSVSRARAFNKPNIQKFFRSLEEVILKYRFKATNIYDVDKSGLSTVQNPPKVFVTKGRKQVGGITSAECGTHTTAVCCMSASGTYSPPAFIFARTSGKQSL